MVAKRRRKGKIVAICLLCAAGLIAVLLSPLFRIKQIKINSISSYQESDISVLLEDLVGVNGFLAIFRNTSIKQSKSLFGLRLPDREDELIFQLPYLKDVQIHYSFPNTLVVDAMERTPIFLAQQQGIYLYVDSEGYLLETFTEEDKPDLPVVLGLEIDRYKIGRSLTGLNDKRIDTAIRLCNMMRQLSILNSDIFLIDLTDLNDIWMYCDNGISIRFGDNNDMGMKLSKLKSIQEIAYSGKTNGVLDFTGGGHPVFRQNQGGTPTPSGTPDSSNTPSPDSTPEPAVTPSPD